MQLVIKDINPMFVSERLAVASLVFISLFGVCNGKVVGLNPTKLTADFTMTTQSTVDRGLSTVNCFSLDQSSD